MSEPSLKERWITALRSGDYQQGFTRLKNADGSYCCLGVLCDVSGEGEWNTESFDDSSFSVLSHVFWIPMDNDEEIYDANAPVSLVHKAMRDSLNEKGSQQFQNMCMILNDDLNATFDEIAHFIESYNEDYFNPFEIHWQLEGWLTTYRASRGPA